MSNVTKSLLVGAMVLVSLVAFRKTAAVEKVELDASSVKFTTVDVKKATSKKKIIRLSPPSNRVVYFDSEVTRSSSDVVIQKLKALDTTTDPVFLLINSPGGDVFAGMSVITQMEGMQAPVYTVCTKVCASMAAFIHQYGTKRYALDRSFLMFHPASGGAEGQLPNMLSMLGTVQRSLDKMNTYIVNKAHITTEEFQKKLAYQLWSDGEDSQRDGFVDELVVITSVPNEESIPFSLFGNSALDTTFYMKDLIK